MMGPQEAIAAASARQSALAADSAANPPVGNTRPAQTRPLPANGGRPLTIVEKGELALYATPAAIVVISLTEVIAKGTTAKVARQGLDLVKAKLQRESVARIIAHKVAGSVAGIEALAAPFIQHEPEHSRPITTEEYEIRDIAGLVQLRESSLQDQIAFVLNSTYYPDKIIAASRFVANPSMADRLLLRAAELQANARNAMHVQQLVELAAGRRVTLDAYTDGLIYARQALSEAPVQEWPNDKMDP